MRAWWSLYEAWAAHGPVLVIALAAGLYAGTLLAAVVLR